MTASAKFSLKFLIGLPDYRETHEDLHCETVVLDDCGGWLSSSLLSRFRSSPEGLFLKPVYLIGSRLDPVLASRAGPKSSGADRFKVLT
jgi:hypothetical protein